MSPTLASSTKPTEKPLHPRCAHCGLEAPLAVAKSWVLKPSGSKCLEDESPKHFCCRGCMGAYSLIHQLGLEDFYSLRTLRDHDPEPVHKTRASDVLRNLNESGVPIETLSDGTCRVRLGIEGLHCAACSWLIESLPPSIPGLKAAHVRLGDRSVELLYDPARTEPFRVAEYFSKLGYLLGPLQQDQLEDQLDRRLRQEHWFWLAVSFFLAANAMWIAISLYAGEATGMALDHAWFLRSIGAFLGLLSAVLPGRVFFQSAWQSIKTRVPHVDVPVAIGLMVGTIGSIVGAVTGKGHVYFDSLASLVLLLRIGRYIQFRAQFRSGMSIAKLLRFNDIEAVRLTQDGQEVRVPANRLQPGDRVRVHPGGMVPADGLIALGKTELQTAFITGESRPKEVTVGDQVVGGALNVQSAIEIAITSTAQEGRLGQISRLVQQATADRTPLIQLADRVGRLFVWVVLAIAVMTGFVWWYVQGPAVAIERTVALLTIACPCALALAAPLVITVAIGRAAKERIWIRDGSSLERLAKPGLMCLDKTGTLTYGDLRVIDWSGPDSILPAIAAIESRSEHPIAQAIIEFVETDVPIEKQQLADAIVPEEIKLELGRGISGTVEGREYFIGRKETAELDTSAALSSFGEGTRCVEVTIDGEFQGAFVLGDRIRPNMLRGLKAIADRGWRLAILSGDDSPQVAQIACELESAGIELLECRGGLSPEEKKVHMERLGSEGRTTVMVGDGINDAVALAGSDVGIAVRGPSEIALKNAPVYIGENHFEAIPRLLDASRNAVRAIHRCFAVSLLYNCITIGLAATGYIHPLIAAVFMPISGITVLAMAWSARTFPTRQRSEP